MPCPTETDLLSFAVAEPDLPSRVPLAAHVATCPACSRAVAELAELRHLASDEVLPAPPPWTLRRAQRIAAEAGERTIAARIYRTARLVVDTLVGPAPVGARNAAPGARQMLYRADDYDVDVRVTAAGEGAVRLAGQVIPPADRPTDEPTSVRVTLAGGEGAALGLTTGPLGEFAFGPIPEGTYDLVLECDGAEILVEGLPARAE